MFPLGPAKYLGLTVLFRKGPVIAEEGVGVPVEVEEAVAIAVGVRVAVKTAVGVLVTADVGVGEERD